MKVYCYNCKYFKKYTITSGVGIFDFSTIRRCEAITAISMRESYSTPKKPIPAKKITHIVGDYEKQNKNNNCEHYTRKWYKFWV